MISVRYGSAVAVLVSLVLLFAAGELKPLDFKLPRPPATVYSPVDLFKELVTGGQTRVYATPNFHLVHSFLSGIPVQSIAPVRKSFLDGYDGDILLVDYRNPAGPAGALAPRRLQEQARESGVILSDEEAKRWARRLASWLLRRDLLEKGFAVQPPLEELPPHLVRVVAEQHEPTRGHHAIWGIDWPQSVIFRGYDTRSLGWWEVFFYRFVQPEKRAGENLNYADRMRNATAYVADESPWVVFHSPPRLSEDIERAGSR